MLLYFYYDSIKVQIRCNLLIVGVSGGHCRKNKRRMQKLLPVEKPWNKQLASFDSRKVRKYRFRRATVLEHVLSIFTALICHAAAFPIHIQYLLFLLQIFQSWTSLKEFPLVSQMAMIKSWTLKLFWNLTKACISKQSSYAQKNITVCLVVDAVQHIQLILTF